MVLAEVNEMVWATDFYSEEDYYAALDERVATEGEADREFAHEVGRANPDRPWVLSDRDVWYPNPYYTGPKARHPEDDADEDYEEARDTVVYDIAEEDFPF